MAPVVFLPGILMPAAARYAPLLRALGSPPDAYTKELEIYRDARPPEGYTIQDEIDGLLRFADEHDLGRFHLYGHSAGGAIAIGFVAEHADRVASLALDEAATDFSADDLEAVASIEHDVGGPSGDLSWFVRSLVKPEVALPSTPAPAGDGSEMAKRPAGVAAFRAALMRHAVDDGALRRFAGPVYYSYGSLSHPRWETMAARMATRFADATTECYVGLHHLNTSHTAEPERVAAELRRLWTRAGD